MKAALVCLVKINPSEITDTRLDRLFKLLSFHKLENLQPSDFERLLSSGADTNPFLKPEAPETIKDNFKKSLGGGLAQTDLHDWKLSCL